MRYRIVIANNKTNDGWFGIDFTKGILFNVFLLQDNPITPSCYLPAIRTLITHLFLLVFNDHHSMHGLRLFITPKKVVPAHKLSVRHTAL